MSPPFDRRAGPPPSARNRVNLQIRVPEVRVLDEDNNQLGVMTSDAARQIAREKLLDLVEISPTAVPPVCKIMDYGKFKYEQKKKEGDSKKKQHQMQLKEVRFRTRTDEGDVETKMNKAREFLEQGDKVSFYVMFRGREVVHPEIGHRILKRCEQELADVGKVERAARLEGKRMTMIITPGKASGAPAPAAPARPQAPRPPSPPRPQNTAAPAAEAPRPAPAGPASENPSLASPE